MNFLRRSALAILACAVALAPLAGLAAPAKKPAAASRSEESATPYKGAVVIDAATGHVLFEQNAGIVSPPASMTKLMTFLVLHDKLQSGALTLQTPVTVTAADSKIGGTQVWLKEGEVFPVEELLFAMMIQSANDAAHALARTAAGSPAAFVELMNAKARELGMAHTTFRTPHGLPPSNRRISEGDLTTPHDFAVLSRELLLKTDVIRYTSVKTRPFGTGVRTPDKVITMINHDHLLTKVAGVDGLKTGFTNGAGFCLSSTAQRNGRRVIAVVMGSPDSKTRDLKVAELLERGFAAIPVNAPTFTSTTVASPPAATRATAPAPEASPISAVPVSSEQKKAAAAEEPASPVIKFPAPKTR